MFFKGSTYCSERPNSKKMPKSLFPSYYRKTHKQPQIDFLIGKSSENIQQIYKKTLKWKYIYIKLLCNFTEIILRHGRFPVNLLYISRIPTNTATSENTRQLHLFLILSEKSIIDLSRKISNPASSKSSFLSLLETLKIMILFLKPLYLYYGLIVCKERQCVGNLGS